MTHTFDMNPIKPLSLTELDQQLKEQGFTVVVNRYAYDHQYYANGESDIYITLSVRACSYTNKQDPLIETFDQAMESLKE